MFVVERNTLTCTNVGGLSSILVQASCLDDDHMGGQWRRLAPNGDADAAPITPGA